MRSVFNIGLLACILTILNYDIYAASLDGTSTPVYQDTHYVFRSNDIAQGFVRLNDGFTILQDESATLDTFITASGDIDLRVTGTMILGGDLYLSSNVTFTNEGDIFGNGFALHLGDDLTIPENVTLHIIDDLVIDGRGCTINFEPHAQLLVDCNSTLTIKNATLCNTRNTLSRPFVRLAQSASSLAFDNVMFKMTDDFLFQKGQLYFHNDVVITGTSTFIFQPAAVCSFVAPCSSLYVDKDTTFYYNPAAANRELLQLQSKTSNLIFDNASLIVSQTGMKLTRGRLCLDNCVTLSIERCKKDVAQILLSDVVDTAAFNSALGVDWSPCGRYLAAAFDKQGLAGDNRVLKIYSFNNSTLSEIVSYPYNNTGNHVKWRSDGRYLAFTGARTPSNDDNLLILRFDVNNTNTLTLVDSIPEFSNSEKQVLDWSPDGKYLVYSEDVASGPNNDLVLIVNEFNGLSLTFTFSLIITHNSNALYETAAWSPDGRYIATGSTYTGATEQEQLRIVKFENDILTTVTSLFYGTSGSKVLAVAWHPDEETLAVGGVRPSAGVGGFDNEDLIRVYRFDGEFLTPITTQEFAGNGSDRAILDLTWSPDGKFLSSSGSIALAPIVTELIQLYCYDGYSLSLTASVSVGFDSSAVSWRPDGQFIAFSGDTGGGDYNLAVGQPNYQCGQVFPCTYQTSLCLGDASQGEEADLDVTINSDARVCLDGVLNYDPVS